jgi:molecular chaperone GrpE
MTSKSKTDPMAEESSDLPDEESVEAEYEGYVPEPRAGTESDPAAEIETAKLEAARHRDQYLRAVAELQNIQRRHERDRAELSKFATEALLRDLLPTIDDLERAIEHAGASGAARGEGLVAGVEMVHKALMATLEKHGLRRVDALGQPFDPSLHEAVSMAEDADAEPNTVIAEHRPGYTLGDRLLRPAMVVVSMAKAAAIDS